MGSVDKEELNTFEFKSKLVVEMLDDSLWELCIELIRLEMSDLIFCRDSLCFSLMSSGKSSNSLKIFLNKIVVMVFPHYDIRESKFKILLFII